MTSSPIGTWVSGTIIDVYLTFLTRETSPTAAHTNLPKVKATTIICTRVACAPVYFFFTVRPCEAKRANASVAGPLILFQACATVEAWRIYTCQSAVLTVSAIVARGAQAVITVLHIRATATVPTGIAVALADLVFAVDAGEAGFARARVAALASVHASCSIFAWPVVSAVVQILITEEATPSFITYALPLCFTSPVAAAYMGNAFITVAALPTRTADALSRLVAISILFSTSSQTDGLGAVLAGPAGQAGQAPVRRAHVVPEAVVAALAEAGAALAVVVLAAHHAVGVAQLGQRVLMHVLRPVLAHRQRPLDRHLADEPLLRGRPGAFRQVVVGRVPGLDDHGEGSRPREVKGQLNGAVKSLSILDAEGVYSQNRGDDAAESAGARGNHCLKMLQTNAKEGPAVGGAGLPAGQRRVAIHEFV